MDVAGCALAFFLLLLKPSICTAQIPTQNNEKIKLPIVRWSEQQPGCTFARGDDGKYRYGLWSGDVDVIVAVDAREVQIIRHRIEPIFGVLLTVRYRGAASLEESVDGITLQFLEAFQSDGIGD
jgi:hypothetical protein